jgi:hypothetical protein
MQSFILEDWSKRLKRNQTRKNEKSATEKFIKDNSDVLHMLFGYHLPKTQIIKNDNKLFNQSTFPNTALF